MSAPIMNPAIMYHHAEVAAGWMDRGDDVNEAQAVRQLIAEHKALMVQVSGRVAACLSACQGVPDGLLHQGAYREMMQAQTDLTIQRDELLAALENLKDAIEFTPLGMPALQWLKTARIAIAKAKGGAA